MVDMFGAAEFAHLPETFELPYQARLPTLPSVLLDLHRQQACMRGRTLVRLLQLAPSRNARCGCAPRGSPKVKL